jgi:hypothetical protein
VNLSTKDTFEALSVVPINLQTRETSLQRTKVVELIMSTKCPISLFGGSIECA